MIAEVCSRFGGYPSTYIYNHTLGQLFFDHKYFLALVKAEEKANKAMNNGS